MTFMPSYIKTDDQRDVFLLSVLFISITAFIFPYERTLVAQELLTPYTVLKLTPTILSLPFFYFLTKNPYDQLSTFMLFILLSMYSAIGEFFSPLYFYAFMLGMLGFTILLRPKLRTLLPFVFLGGIPTLYIQHLKSSGVIAHAREAVGVDYIFMAVEFIVVILVIFEGYSKKRRREIQYRERFSLIGENANAFAHNIKSMLTSQQLLSKKLKAQISDPKKSTELLELHQSNLKGIQDYLNEFNVLEKTGFESVNVKLALLRVVELLRIPTHLLVLDIKENSHINIIKQDFETILINILSNALKSITNDSEELKVEIGQGLITISYPKCEDYPVSSGIGEKICKKLARKNNISIDIANDSTSYIATLTL